MSNRAEYLYSELRKYSKESGGTLSDAEKDRAMVATLATFVEQEFGHMMGKDAWSEYVARRSKHITVRGVQ